MFTLLNIEQTKMGFILRSRQLQTSHTTKNLEQTQVCIYQPAERGFTRLDLLALLAVLGLLALMMVTALARTKTDSRAFQCLNNLRELTLGWRMYCDDNQDQMPYASEKTDNLSTYSRAWITGVMDNNPANSSNWDVTAGIQKSPLRKYCGTNAAIWRCPADQSFVIVGGVARPRVRSMAMNFYLGGFGGDVTYSVGAPPQWKLFDKVSDLAPMQGSKLFVLLDMREDSIDAGNFFTQMDGFSETTPNGSAYGFKDLPGAYHDAAAALTYADGRGEIHRWLDPRTTPPLVKNGQVNDQYASTNNPDVAWLQDRATRKPQ